MLFVRAIKSITNESFEILIEKLFLLATKSPSKLLRQLETEDPFGLKLGPDPISMLNSSPNIDHLAINPYPRWADPLSIVNTTALEMFRNGDEVCSCIQHFLICSLQHC